ncbi:hypothetical protein [Flammeovirga sp. SJP92]|uniref:hypothetical protein n=1 Tax=Flammeovirga sp. SJP92 TaxID=1775430 RepID=UPI0007878A1D|nr:hypothetical protein [Flammeovirga sp. SJP92]KXX70788.1 hypothetical protein AVL50_07050 [Flammeovirga sp. SJP92]
MKALFIILAFIYLDCDVNYQSHNNDKFNYVSEFDTINNLLLSHSKSQFEYFYIFLGIQEKVIYVKYDDINKNHIINIYENGLLVKESRYDGDFNPIDKSLGLTFYSQCKSTISFHNAEIFYVRDNYNNQYLKFTSIGAELLFTLSENKTDHKINTVYQTFNALIAPHL